MKKIDFLDEPGQFQSLNGWIQKKGFTSVFVLTDDNTSVNCLSKIKNSFSFPFHSIRIPPGEKSKSIETVEGIWNTLFKHGADKKSLLINLGGGVVSDVGGFVASTFKRGITYVNIPTSLLAMVDAAIGGKTGINYAGAKNQIGTVYEPEKIIIYPPFLQTLPHEEFMSGLAEMFKHGLIADENYYRQLKNYPSYPMSALIHRSVEIKTSITEKDLHESGMRQILNFGHTVGHAVESYLAEEGTPITHGHAVALGMIAEAFISVHTTGLSRRAYEDIKQIFLTYYNPAVIHHADSEKLTDIMRLDKKNRNGEIKFTLLENIGKAVWGISVPDELIHEALLELKSL